MRVLSFLLFVAIISTNSATGQTKVLTNVAKANGTVAAASGTLTSTTQTIAATGQSIAMAKNAIKGLFGDKKAGANQSVFAITGIDYGDENLDKL